MYAAFTLPDGAGGVTIKLGVSPVDGRVFGGGEETVTKPRPHNRYFFFFAVFLTSFTTFVAFFTGFFAAFLAIEITVLSSAGLYQLHQAD